VLAQRVHQQHQLLRCVPGVEEHALKGQRLVADRVDQHLAHMIELGLAVLLGREQSVVDGPILTGIGVDVQAVHQTNTFDEAVSVATVLPTYKLDMVRMVLVQDRVVKHDAAVRRGDDISLGMLPDVICRQLIALQIALHRVVADALHVIGEIRHREILRTA
jgi:hypothetical protein